MRAFVLIVAVGSSTGAAAEEGSLLGRGRLELLLGANSASVDSVETRAVAAGLEPVNLDKVGPSAWASFGYGATENIEAVLELLACGQGGSLGGSYRRTTYGGMAAARFWGIGWLSPMFEPYVQFGLASVVVSASRSGAPLAEVWTTGIGGAAGLRLALSTAWGLSVEYRYLYARGAAPDPIEGTIDGGGHFVLLGISYGTPTAPSPAGRM